MSSDSARMYGHLGTCLCQSISLIRISVVQSSSHFYCKVRSYGRVFSWSTDIGVATWKVLGGLDLCRNRHAVDIIHIKEKGSQRGKGYPPPQQSSGWGSLEAPTSAGSGTKPWPKIDFGVYYNIALHYFNALTMLQYKIIRRAYWRGRFASWSCISQIFG